MPKISKASNKKTAIKTKKITTKVKKTSNLTKKTIDLSMFENKRVNVKLREK